MTRPSDLHWDRVTPEAYHRAGTVLRAVTDLDVPWVLAGGWAVFAHVPRVPSVDVDLFVAPDDAGAVRQHLRPLGLHVAEGGEVELLDVAEPVELWGFGDPDLGIRAPSFQPSRLLEGRTGDRDLDLPEGTAPARVPTRPALAVTKLAALRNRDLAFRAHREGRAAMLLGPQRANRVRTRAPGYHRWKAGKDLLDLGLLLTEDRRATATRTLVQDLDLLSPARETLRDLSDAAKEVARDLADREGLPDPHGIVNRSFGMGANPPG